MSRKTDRKIVDAYSRGLADGRKTAEHLFRFPFRRQRPMCAIVTSFTAGEKAAYDAGVSDAVARGPQSDLDAAYDRGVQKGSSEGFVRGVRRDEKTRGELYDRLRAALAANGQTYARGVAEGRASVVDILDSLEAKNARQVEMLTEQERVIAELRKDLSEASVRFRMGPAPFNPDGSGAENASVVEGCDVPEPVFDPLYEAADIVQRLRGLLKVGGPTTAGAQETTILRNIIAQRIGERELKS